MHVPEREEKPVWKGSLWAFSISMTFWKGATVETVGRAVVVRGQGWEAGLGGARDFGVSGRGLRLSWWTACALAFEEG